MEDLNIKDAQADSQEQNIRAGLNAHIIYGRALRTLFTISSQTGEAAAPALANLIDDAIENDRESLYRGYLVYLVNFFRSQAHTDFLKNNMLRAMITLTSSKHETWLSLFGLKAYVGDVKPALLAAEIMKGNPGVVNTGATDIENSLGLTTDEIGFGVLQIYIEYACRELDIKDDGIEEFINDLLDTITVNKKMARALSFLLFLCVNENHKGIVDLSTTNELARILLFAKPPEHRSVRESVQTEEVSEHDDVNPKTDVSDDALPQSTGNPSNVLDFNSASKKADVEPPSE